MLYAMTFQGDYGYQDSAESIILSACDVEHDANSGGYKKETIGDCQYQGFASLVNSTSTVQPIGLPPKGAKFCHTLNIFIISATQDDNYGASKIILPDPGS